MNDASCHYAILHAARERHDEVVREVVAPLARRFVADPELDSLFFARYNKPDWQVRFRVLGPPDWIASEVRPVVERAVREARAAAVVEGASYDAYRRELERYGGEEGMRLAERLFTIDTIACIELLELEARGGLERSRREWSLVYVERLFERLGLDRVRRAEVYRFSYSWTLDQDFWSESDLAVLEERYRALRDGLEDLFSGATAEDPAAQFGGAEAAAIAERAMQAAGPVASRVAEGVTTGTIRQDLGHLAWSYGHMHCNRLGIEAHAEAILRYFMHRFHEDHPDPAP